MQWRRWCAAWLLAAPMLAQAQPLTLQEALRLATEHSPALAMAEAQRQGAQAAVKSAHAFQNPELEVASGVSRSRQPGGAEGRNEMVGIAQPIEFPSTRSARQGVAAAGAEAGDAALEAARLEQRAAVKQAYFDVLRRQEEAALAQENLALLEQIRDRVKVKVSVGEAARYELVKSEAETLAAESALQSAEVRVVQARDWLRALIGAPLDEHFEVAPEPLWPASLPALDELRRDLLANQPRLKVGEAETRRAQARVEQERAARLSQFTLKLSAERDPDMSQWRVGIAVPLPLWDRRSGPIGEALSNQQRAEAEARHSQLGMLAELDRAYGRYSIARRQVETFEAGLLKEAESAMNVAEAAYRYGERGIIDYLDAQRVWRATRVDFLNARYELQSAMIDIERLRALPVSGDS
ncbi:MAG TPA: TolC family protein [Gallionellaceae bacterium]